MLPVEDVWAAALARALDRRVAADADVDTLAPALIGAGHLLFADREGVPPEAGAVRTMVATVIASVVKER